MKPVHIKIGVCAVEPELPVAQVGFPVFPSFVPSLNQHSIYAMLCGKVDVALNVGGIGCMVSVRLKLGIVGYARFGKWGVGIAPRASRAVEHLPPYTYKLHWLNPRRVGYLARLVEVQYEP